MKIILDAREISKKQHGGFRSYIKGLLYGLSKVDFENEYLLIINNDIDQSELDLPIKSRFIKVSGNRIIADHISIYNIIRNEKPDVVHFTCNYGMIHPKIPMIISLLDCFTLSRKEKPKSLKSKILFLYSAFMIKKTIPFAEKIITISEYSKNQILDYFNAEDKINIIYIAGKIKKNIDLPIRDSIKSINFPFFLHLASVDLRKNSKSAIEAFSKASSMPKDHRFVIIASHPSVVDIVNEFVLEYGVCDRVDIISGVNDAELEFLYSKSSALIFPSLDEGFGLPPIEAMSHGCPVLSSDIPIMTEIQEDAALYFNPLDPNDIASKMDRLVNDTDLRFSLRQKGYIQSSSYSWEKTASQTVDVYKEIVRRI